LGGCFVYTHTTRSASNHFALYALLQGLSRADALAALLLAAEDGGNVEGALMRAATCMDLGSCAKLWREQHAPPPEVVDLQDAAAAEDAARQAQQERERQVRANSVFTLSCFSNSRRCCVCAMLYLKLV
jgi:hypothetical protein